MCAGTYYSEDSEVELKKERRKKRAGDKSGSGTCLVFLVFGMYKGREREREYVCVYMCMYVFVNRYI